MPRIFLSFRKTDSRWMRERLYKALVDSFGADAIFKAGESIPPGADFAEILRRQAADCELMVVLIGATWLDGPGSGSGSASGSGGGRLLDRADDWVRTEIATAMRAGNRVIPVLVGDGTMLPSAAQLPADIAGLAGLQFLRVSETHLDGELERLRAAVAALLPDLGPAPSSADSAPAPAAAPARSVSLTSHVSGGGSAFQAAGDQTITFGNKGDEGNGTTAV